MVAVLTLQNAAVRFNGEFHFSQGRTPDIRGQNAEIVESQSGGDDLRSAHGCTWILVNTD